MKLSILASVVTFVLLTKAQQIPLAMSHGPESGNDLLLSDVLPMERSANIFASLLRSHPDTDSLIADKSANLTVLAPSNSALRALPQKPWEDSRDYAAFGAEEAYKGSSGEDRAQNNLARFLNGHMVRNDGKAWGEGEKRTTVRGTEVWWSEKDGKKVIQPDGVEVGGHVDERASNGDVWVLNGVLGQQ